MNREKEIIFLRTYKDFIYFFNMLDRNIGYCLRHCLESRDGINPKKWLLSGFNLKVEKILSLANEVGVEDKFTEWKVDIKKCRHLRNIITHGHWEWNEHSDKPISYHAPEIDNGKGKFTNDEFISKLDFLKEVSETFGEIRTPLEKACYKYTQSVGGNL